MDKLSNTLKCVHCKKVLESPVLLPCGHPICMKHTVDNKEQLVLCHSCGIEHPIPASGFVHMKFLHEIIDAQIFKLDFGKEHNTAKKSCEQFDQLLTNIELMLKDPYTITYEIITSLKNKVQQRGEEMILKINANMHRFISKLDEYKQECKESNGKSDYVAKSNTLEMEKETARQDLDNWMATLNKISFDEVEWKRIQSESKKAILSFEKKMVEFKIDLFPKGFKQLKGEIEETFGKSNIESKFYLNLELDSTIIADFHMKNELFNLCEFISSQRLDLLYRGSLHGFAASDFHSKCDNISKTLTIIKAESGNIFGGYTEAMWESTRNEITKPDKSAFIFSLVNKENNPVKVNIASGKESNAIVCYKLQGPSFGLPDATDILINNDCNLNFDSLCNFGHNYVLKNYPGNSKKAESFLAGSYKFKVDEIEVFQLPY